MTDAVVDSVTAMYQENAPELVYYMALYRIFSEFLDDVSEDVLPNEGTGFKQSAIWGKLYDFQKDADNETLEQRSANDAKLAAMKDELAKLDARRKKEKQFARKNEMFEQAKELKRRIAVFEEGR